MNHSEVVNRIIHYRQLIVESRQAPLFHGTRLASLLHILETDRLGNQHRRDPFVSLSRSPTTAAYFAHSDEPWAAYGAILVLDQQKLVHRHKIVPHHDASNLDPNAFADEQEERVIGVIEPVSAFLISINADPAMLRRAAVDRDYLRDDEEMNELFDRRKRQAVKLLRGLLTNPLLNRWTHLQSS